MEVNAKRKTAFLRVKLVTLENVPVIRKWIAISVAHEANKNILSLINSHLNNFNFS